MRAMGVVVDSRLRVGLARGGRGLVFGAIMRIGAFNWGTLTHKGDNRGQKLPYRFQ